MKKNLFITLLFVTVLFTNLFAQLETIHHFDGTNGEYLYGSLVSDGTYMYGMANTGGVNNVGTIFKIKISDNTFTKMFDFTINLGVAPYGSLFLVNNYLYGMTCFGGANSEGVIFKINKNNNFYEKIFDFDDSNLNNIGKYPLAGFVSDGTYLYACASQGGADDYGTIFKVAITNDLVTKMYDFDENFKYPQSNPVFFNDEVLFVTVFEALLGNGAWVGINKNTNALSDYYNNYSDGKYPKGAPLFDNGVFSLLSESDGSNNYGGMSIKNVYSNFSWTDGANPEGAFIKVDNSYYATTKNGGNDDVGIIFKININSVKTTLHEFNGTDGAHPRGSLLQVGNYLYGLTYDGGDNNKGTVFKYQYTTSKVGKLSNSDINIYPNPTTDFLTLNSKNKIDKIEISDISSKLIFSKNVNNKTVKIETSNLANGIYFIKTFVNNETFINKIVKQ